MEKKRKSKKKSRPDKVYEYRLSTPLPKIHTLGLASFIITDLIKTLIIDCIKRSF